MLTQQCRSTPAYRSKINLAGTQNLISMSSVIPFAFNAVKLYVVTINKKPWTRAREACRALQYGKTTKAANIVKHLCSRENYAHKYQLNEFVFETYVMDWPKDSRKDDYYVNEEGMYEIVFSSSQPKAKDFRRHCCNVLFPHAQQQLTNKMKEDHQQAIEEKDNQIQAQRQKILRLNEEIDDPIKTDMLPAVDILTKCCALLERIARRPTHITLFDVSIDSSKNIKNVFVTQTWKRTAGVMTQMLFTNGTYSRVK